MEDVVMISTIAEPDPRVAARRVGADLRIAVIQQKYIPPKVMSRASAWSMQSEDIQPVAACVPSYTMGAPGRSDCVVPLPCVGLLGAPRASSRRKKRVANPARTAHKGSAAHMRCLARPSCGDRASHAMPPPPPRTPCTTQTHPAHTTDQHPASTSATRERSGSHSCGPVSAAPTASACSTPRRSRPCSSGGAGAQCR